MPTEPPPDWVLNRRRRYGARIRDLRLARRMSQEELGAAVDLDRRTVSRIESGTVTPSLDTLIRITHVLGHPLHTLFE